ncbi:hypothetical protein SY83_10840 [Paenibacillus swuensis]|uniref:Uncharacterized protein n=1 Tax=Paenibacillus swuensis TaxID=1178515 RepID=A0A172THZ8_9BACL|nr:flagellar hook-basal body protein [Paenibacillus swuensis]ANE46685.1 hypothetical protein SY83_10840 [Paenibacillus swuensis]
MNRSMITAGISMQGLQQKLDLMANNIANVNTVGYKKQEASFQDVLTNTIQQQPKFNAPGRLSPLGYTQGWGSYLANIQTNYTQGPLKESGSPLDFAIQGDALFEVGVAETDENGTAALRTAYTRGGNFQLTTLPNQPGSFLSTQDGYMVMGVQAGRVQPIRIPEGHGFAVDAEGNITTTNLNIPGARPVAAGRIQLVQATQPEMLQNIGNNLYGLKDGAAASAVTPLVLNANNPRPGQPAIRQGFLEQSNVDLADEMSELMVVQRAFQLNSRALSSSDSMAGLANNLRG